MAGQDSYVDPAEMTAFVGRTHGVADRFETMRASGAGTEVGRMSFGLLPASFQLWDIYQQVAEACRTGLSDGYEAFEEIAGGVADERDAYEANEVANLDLFKPREA
ncbi:hypothetical protein GCM10009827_002600 [Dactylosporangium maewongense]|uniref:Excreted virulence factor EspC (Type VII ESX diderm) n=1 Tax=Dactylosporangium maewongense TaxID=634393 RepID=A0ABN1ZIE8_9ACTN